MNQKIRDREIDKRYLCITVGTPRPPQGEAITASCCKDEKKKQVAVYHRPVPGGKTAVDPLPDAGDPWGAVPAWRCELLTGRTHQIRRAPWRTWAVPCWGTASTADEQVNRRYGETRQALYSYRLTFDFPTDAGLLNYLQGPQLSGGERPTSGRNTSADRRPGCPVQPGLFFCHSPEISGKNE